MEQQLSLIEYFNYDLELLLDEFNNYFHIKHREIPLYLQAMYLYFSHLAENSLDLLIKSGFNYKKAYDIKNVPNIYIKPFSEGEINNFLRFYQPKPQIFYGLCGYPLYFFQAFLDHIKYGQDKKLTQILTSLPILEDNLRKIHRTL